MCGAIAVLRLRRTIPRAVEGDERAAPVPRGKHGPGVEQDSIRRPMAGEWDDRGLRRRAASHRATVAAELGAEHPLGRAEIVIAVRPTEVVAAAHLKQFLGWVLGAVRGGEHARERLEEVVAAVL